MTKLEGIAVPCDQSHGCDKLRKSRALHRQPHQERPVPRRKRSHLLQFGQHFLNVIADGQWLDVHTVNLRVVLHLYIEGSRSCPGVAILSP